MDAKSAATHSHDSEQCWMALRIRPADVTARVDRPRLPLMKAPLPLSPARAVHDRRAGSRANQRAVLISAVNATVCLPSDGYMEAATTCTRCFCRRTTDPRTRCGRQSSRRTAGLICMTVRSHTPNQLLQTLDAADFDRLRSHRVTVKMVRESVLGETSAALSPSGTIDPHGRAVVGRHAGSIAQEMPWSDILSQLPIYPDGNMMELTRTASDFAYRGSQV